MRKLFRWLALPLAVLAVAAVGAAAWAGSGLVGVKTYDYQGGDAHVRLDMNYNHPGPDGFQGVVQGEFFEYQINGTNIDKVYLQDVFLWKNPSSPVLVEEWSHVPDIFNVGADDSVGPKVTDVRVYCDQVGQGDNGRPTYWVEAKYKLHRTTEAGWTDLFDENSYNWSDSQSC